MIKSRNESRNASHDSCFNQTPRNVSRRLTGWLFLAATGLVLGLAGIQFGRSQEAGAAETSPVAATNLLVYVASPLGFADSTRAFMYTNLIPAIEAEKFTALNPWDSSQEVNDKIAAAKSMDSLTARRRAWESIVDLLGKNNAQAIKKADGVVAVLDGVDVDSGTAAEIGYAAASGKWIVGYRSDFRRTGEDQTAEVNLQVEFFIRQSGGVIVHSLPELQAVLKYINLHRKG